MEIIKHILEVFDSSLQKLISDCQKLEYISEKLPVTVVHPA